MKKLMKSGIVAGLLVLSMCGCGTSKNSQEATTENPLKEIVVDYSKGLNEKGQFEGYKASDIVTLCDYKNIQIPKAEVEPGDQEIEDEITKLLNNYGVREGKVKDGDTVNINYVGTIDGKQFEGGSASNASLTIGTNTFIDNFEDQIIGHTPGETFDVKVTFPEDYQSKDYAGKDADFSVTLNYIVPKLTDKFVAENFSEGSGISTVKEFRKKVKETIRKSKMNNYVWDYFLTNCKFKDIPEDILEARLDVSVDIVRKQYRDYMGYSDKQILEAAGVKSMKKLRKQYQADTEKNIKNILIAGAIAKECKLSVSEKSLKKFLGDDYNSYYEVYGKPYVHAQVLISLVSDYVLDHCKVK